jgi:methyl-accepting chemotaxis protein
MNITLKKQILAFAIIPMLLIACVIISISIYNINSMGEARIADYREALFQQKKTELMNYVEIVLKIIEDQSPEEAKKTVRKVRYGENGYFWLNDFNHRLIAHPDPRLNDTNQADLKDSNSVYYIKEIVKVCQEKGEGFVKYHIRHLEKDQPLPKLSYVKVIPKFNWIIGTGVYVDDIEAMVTQERERTWALITSLIKKNIAITTVIVLFTSLLVAYFVNSNVNRPMGKIIGALQNFDNDLTCKITDHFPHEFGELTRQFNNLIGELNGIITQVAQMTIDLNHSLSDISSMIDEQSAISTEQSSSISEITSTMEEFSATSKQISGHAAVVVEIATTALQSTQKGAEAVETVKLKIKEINQDNENNLKEIVTLGRKSKDISKIMEIINNIADQTKLIAFNAALEAASAGEAGKRFGVVAAEIRRLADSVTESTGDIDRKIREIQEAVNRLVIVSENNSKKTRESLDYSNQTVNLLLEIVNGANATVNAARQISLSTNQQETASEQVVVALREIDQGVRQTSDAISHTNAATLALKTLADNLKTLIHKFKVGKDA